MSHGPGFGNFGCLGRTVFRDKGSDEICAENPMPTAVHFLVSLPANAAIHVASPNVCKPLEKSCMSRDKSPKRDIITYRIAVRHKLQENAVCHCPCEKCRTHSGKWQQTYSTRLKKELLDKPPKGAQFFGTIALMEFVKTRANSSAFHYVASSQRSSPQAISPRLPIRPQCPRFCLAPFQQLPKLFPTVSHPSTMSSRPYRSPRGKVS